MSATASSEPVLSLEDISIGFDKGNVLDGLSFSVAPRETKILIGESGSGKTLILKLAAGLIQPDAGEGIARIPEKHRIRVSGGRAVRLAHRRRKRGLLPARGARGRE